MTKDVFLKFNFLKKLLIELSYIYNIFLLKIILSEFLQGLFEHLYYLILTEIEELYFFLNYIIV
jgi:hypothetical protein